MRGSGFNLLYGRRPGIVFLEVCRLLEDEKLDYLCVQEATDYRLVLAEVPGYTYYTGKSVNGGAASEIGILVRDELNVTNVINKAFGDGWWSGLKRGLRMKPRNFMRLTINGKHIVANLHQPSGVDLKTQQPYDRYQDYKALARRAYWFFKVPSRKTRTLVMDSNCRATSREKYSPYWIACNTNAQFSSPDERIDHIITKGLVVKWIKKLNDFKEKSDHNPIVFSVKPKRKN